MPDTHPHDDRGRSGAPTWARRGGLVAVVVLAALALRIATVGRSGLNLPDVVQDGVSLATGIVVESLPFVLLGVFVSALVQGWLPQGFVLGHLPRTPWLRRGCISLMGVLFPVCECGNVPVARGLLVQGFTAGEALTFLAGAPVLNPITVITTWQAFGGDPIIVVMRVVGALVAANLIGWVYARVGADEVLAHPDEIAEEACAVHATTVRGKLAASGALLSDEAGRLLPALLLGASIAAAIQVLVPRSMLLSLGGDPVISILAMLALAFIVSICSNVDAFFALAFHNSFSAGSLVAFLTFGPVVDVKMLSLMRTTFTPRTLAGVTAIMTFVAAISGWVVNLAF